MNSRINDTALQVSLGPLKLRNPVMAASGTFGYGEEYAPLIPLKRLGAIVTKGLSLEPRKGNPPPRLAETPAGMLNAIGLENVGLKVFLREKLPKLRKFRCPILVNIFGNTLEEYGEIARRLGDVEGIAGLEVNISCPNLKAGGSIFAADPRSVLQVTSKVRQATSAFLLVKLSPNVADIGKIAQAAEEGGGERRFLDQHSRGPSYRHTHPHADPRERHRRAIRAGDQTGGPGHGVEGGSIRESACGWHRRDRCRRRRPGVPDCRGDRGGSRLRPFYRPPRSPEDSRRNP
jgi:hypothetical protein